MYISAKIILIVILIFTIIMTSCYSVKDEIKLIPDNKENFTEPDQSEIIKEAKEVLDNHQYDEYINNDVLNSNINRMFKYLKPDERINLSKRRLDEKLKNELEKSLNNLLAESTTIDNNKLIHINSGYMPSFEKNDGKIKIQKSDSDSNQFLKSDGTYGTTDEAIEFEITSINNVSDFNKNLDKDFTSNKKNPADTILFPHRIVKHQSDANDGSKLCLSRSNNELKIEKCNGSSYQKFY